MLWDLSVITRIDKKGRIVIPRDFRKVLDLKEGEEVILTLRGDRILIERAKNPFETLAELLGDLSFDRSLRRIAEEEALKTLSEDR